MVLECPSLHLSASAVQVEYHYKMTDFCALIQWHYNTAMESTLQNRQQDWTIFVSRFFLVNHKYSTTTPEQMVVFTWFFLVDQQHEAHLV